MKRYIIAAFSMLLALTACGPKEDSVLARHVPERSDDFVWENDLVCYRAYGQALEGNPTSPGFDVWVKLPGALVADRRYKDELENGRTYHKDWGNGKDCYKVGVSLGAGASSPVVDGVIQYPATNWRSFEILEKKADKVVFVLDYPSWTMPEGTEVSLKKKITVEAGSYFCKCEDTYSFEGPQEICVAVGVNRHTELDGIINESMLDDRYVLWEKASDQSVEPEEGLIGVAVVLPGADYCGLSADNTHGICTKKVKSGEPVVYYFGSCWSKGEVKSWEKWLETAKAE